MKFYFPVWMKCIWLAFLGVDIFYGTVGALNYVVKSDGEWNVNINIFRTERFVAVGRMGVCVQGVSIRFKFFFCSVGKYNNISFR